MFGKRCVQEMLNACSRVRVFGKRCVRQTLCSGSAVFGKPRKGGLDEDGDVDTDDDGGRPPT